MQVSTPHVVGVDPSLTSTGISDGTQTWLIRSRGHKTDTLDDRAQRLDKLVVGITGHIGYPDLVLIEGPAFASTSGHMHDRSGLWWLIVLALRDAAVPVVEIPPTKVKTYATGKGNANKGAIVDATARRFPDVDTAGDDNACDALWLAAMGLDHLGRAPVQLPQTHRRALDSVTWPEVMS